MKKHIYYLLNILTLLFGIFFNTLVVNGQITVQLLNKPSCFVQPTRTVTQLSASLSECIESIDKRRSPETWVVFIDSENTHVFDKPGGKLINQKLLFGEAFYVIEENSRWIRLLKIKVDYQIDQKGKYIVDKSDIVGWVEKKDVLLWSKPLADEYTLISQKAFLSNNISMDPTGPFGSGKDSVILYKEPKVGSVATTVRIHDFYFVYKVHSTRSGSFYLLGKEPNLNSMNYKSVLIGWAPAERVTLWDSRLSFEPNYNKNAIEERRKKNCQVVAFSTDRACRMDLNNCNYKESLLLTLDQLSSVSDRMTNETSVHDGKERLRFKGQVMRFPLIEYLNAENGACLTTVAIGQLTLNSSIDWIKDTIDTQTYSVFESNVIERVQSVNHLNVLFLVEGITELKTYRNEIVSIIQDLHSLKNQFPYIERVRTGAAIYRDYVEKDSRIGDFAIQKLTPNQNLTIDFLNRPDAFAQISDFDLMDGVPIYRALDKSTILGDFKKDQTNIIIVIGKNRDVSDDRFKPWQKECQDCKIDKNALIDRLMNLGVHVIGISSAKKRSVQQSLLPVLSELNNRHAGNLIEICKRFEKEDDQYRSWCNPFEEVDLWDENGTWTINREFPHYSITNIDNTKAQRLRPFIQEKMATLIVSQKDFFDQVIKVVIDGDAIVSATSFNRAIFEDLLRKIHGNKENYYQILSSLVFSRYKLASPATVPHKHKNSTFPQLTPVIFYTDDELNSAIQLINEFINTIDHSLKDKQAAFINLLKKKYALVTGYPVNSISNDLTVNDIRERIHGLKTRTDGIDLGSVWEISIQDIENMNTEQFNQLYYKLKTSMEHLKRVRSHYPFVYKSLTSNYYWIPAEDTF